MTKYWPIFVIKHSGEMRTADPELFDSASDAEWQWRPERALGEIKGGGTYATLFAVVTVEPTCPLIKYSLDCPDGLQKKSIIA